MADDGLIDLLKDLFHPLGGVEFRRMFGGRGIFRDGVMFGLVAFDTLYFKVDDETRPALEAEGSEPFAYDTRDGRHVVTSYWRAPERLYDEPDAFLESAKAAHAAAMRKAAAKARKPSGRRATRPASAPVVRRRRGRSDDAP